MRTLSSKAGHELLQEKGKPLMGLVSDLIATANELFHPHRPALDAAWAAQKEAGAWLYNLC